MKRLLIISCCAALISIGIAVAKSMSSASGSPESAMMQQDAGEKATFAGGCFWCMEKPFEQLDGVVSVISGYSGGTTTNPTYKTYMSGGHVEVVEITFNPDKISYQELLDVYWKQVDPTDPGGQFVDRGHAYSTAIFYHDEEQRVQAEASKAALEKNNIFTNV